MSTPTLVAVAGLSAIATRFKDESAVTVMEGQEKLGTMTVRDTFAHDVEFDPVDRAAYERFKQASRDTPLLFQALSAIATAPAKMTTDRGFLAIPDTTAHALFKLESYETAGVDVPAAEDADRFQALQELLSSLDGVKGEARAEIDPHNVLGDSPKTVTFPAKVGDALRLVTT